MKPNGFMGILKYYKFHLHNILFSCNGWKPNLATRGACCFDSTAFFFITDRWSCKWRYCMDTSHKAVGSHRLRFMLFRWQRLVFFNRVYTNDRCPSADFSVSWDVQFTLVSCVTIMYRRSIYKSGAEVTCWDWSLHTLTSENANCIQ